MTDLLNKIKKAVGVDVENNKDNKLNPFKEPATIPPVTVANPPATPPATPVTDSAEQSAVKIQNFLQQSGAFNSVKAVAEALADTNGINLETLTAALEGMVSDGVKAAMTGSGRVTAARIDTMKTELSETFANDTKLELAESQMFEELPYLNEEEISPVAKQAFEGFMKQRKGNVKEAIVDTKQYFDNLAGVARPNSQSNIGDDANKQNQNNANEQEREAAASTDFVSLFTDSRQTVDSVNAEMHPENVQTQQLSPEDLAAAAGAES